MADDKIRISWDEVNNPRVDEKLKQQDARAHAQQHYQQPAPPVQSVGLAPTAPRTSIWYNTIFYMAMFGLLGGFLAWTLGEVARAFGPKQLEEFQQVVMEAQAIENAQRKGQISEDQARMALNELEKAVENNPSFKENPYFKVMNDKSLSDEERKHRIKEMVSKDMRRQFVTNLFFYGVCGLMIAVWLAMAESIVGRNWRGVVVNGSVGALLGLLGGLIVSLFIDKLYQAMGGGRQIEDFSWAKQVFARAVGWGILGLFLSAAPGFVMWNWKKLLIGLAGGAIGGLLGGLLFDVLGLATKSDRVSRFIAILAIGGVTGAATGLIENAVKAGWLRVVAGLIAGKQFILYRNPTYIGSSPQCEIYLFKDPQIHPRHAAIHTIPGGFDLEDQGSTSGTFVNGSPVARVRLRNGDQVQIGSTCFTFQEKIRPAT